MSERLTLATSTGLPFLVLAFHVGTGLFAFAAGFIALGARKGAKWHRRAGLIFVYTMIATGISAAVISVYEGKSINGGATIVYLVLTGYAAVRPLPGITRRVEVALMAMAVTLAASGFYWGVTALGMPGYQLAGVPAGMIFFMATIVLLAAVGDVRMIRAGGLQGARRLARHLWRMSFALFIASGSFLLGQMKFIPEPIRFVPLIFALAVSPLLMLLYWMWRVRLKQNLRGIMTARPIEPRRSGPMQIAVEVVSPGP